MDPDALEMTDGEELLMSKPEPIPFELEKVDLERGDYVVDGVSFPYLNIIIKGNFR